jgi:hypothetical protein
MADHLEMPRPAQLLRTTGWSLFESVGLPLLALVLGAWLWGRTAGLLAGLGVVWITAAVRKVRCGTVPSLVIISAILLTIQTAVAIFTGQLWIFLLHFPAGNLALGILFARTARGPKPIVARLAAEVVALRHPADHPGLHRFFQGATWLWAAIFVLLAACLGVLLATTPTAIFLVLSSVATVVLIVAGAGVSALWLRVVLRKHGLGFRFAAA